MFVVGASSIQGFDPAKSRDWGFSVGLRLRILRFVVCLLGCFLLSGQKLRVQASPSPSAPRI